MQEIESYNYLQSLLTGISLLITAAMFYHGLIIIPERRMKANEEARKAYLKAITPSIDYA